MERSELMIKRIFAEEGELPEIAKMRVQEAYDQIYEQVRAQNARDDHNEANEKYQAVIRRNGKGLLKVACFVLACMLALGGTAYAVNLILGRYERMKNMDQKEKEQIRELTQSGGNLVYEPSRAWSAEELARKNKLQVAYKNDEIFPEGALKIVRLGEEYSKDEVCLIDEEDGKEDVLWLPERTLTDEEILEIIEYEEKIAYISYENRRALYAEENPWEQRMESMTDEEVDFYYLAYWMGAVEMNGSFSRAGKSDLKGDVVLTEEEKKLYLRMMDEYLEKNRIPERTTPLPVIEMPSDFDGSEIMLCRYNSCFYFPDRVLTEEDFLEVIDFQKRAEYSFRRIRDEIEIGKRKDWPSLPNDQSKEPEIYEEKAFSEAAKNGRETTIEYARVGDVVLFGSYEQDGNLANGKEEIAWFVLDQDGDMLTLLSREVLDGHRFDSNLDEPVSWADCELRGWLQESFYKNAFSAKEQASIEPVLLKNEYGEDTQDKVWLLSKKEYYNYFAIDPNADCTASVGNNQKKKKTYFERFLGRLHTEPWLLAKPTEAALQAGVSVDQGEYGTLERWFEVDFSICKGSTCWWLRSSSPEYGPHAPLGHTVLSLTETSASKNALGGIRPVIRIRK
ncbi:MAG: hypothetical protein II477_06130 [Lachnospiraceae bacterium]|nr:hypothetical protein [Lachnospiraceae bacterium]MBQ3906126.1 hypothetical protein [Lachnospiraceae bacterium]